MSTFFDNKNCYDISRQLKWFCISSSLTSAYMLVSFIPTIFSWISSRSLLPTKLDKCKTPIWNLNKFTINLLNFFTQLEHLIFRQVFREVSSAMHISCKILQVYDHSKATQLHVENLINSQRNSRKSCLCKNK